MITISWSLSWCVFCPDANCRKWSPVKLGILEMPPTLPKNTLEEKNCEFSSFVFYLLGGRCLSIKKIGCNSSLGIAFEAKNSSHITPCVSHRTQDVQRHGRGGALTTPSQQGKGRERV